jgi:hypothetical protein
MSREAQAHFPASGVVSHPGIVSVDASVLFADMAAVAALNLSPHIAALADIYTPAELAEMQAAHDDVERDFRATEAQVAAERNAPRNYRIVRHYRDAEPGHRIIRRGLTLAEAQAHCSDPETSSSTATSPAARARTRRLGAWFDGYEEAR